MFLGLESFNNIYTVLMFPYQVRGFLLNFGVYHATRAALGLPFQWRLVVNTIPDKQVEIMRTSHACMNRVLKYVMEQLFKICDGAIVFIVSAMELIIYLSTYSLFAVHLWLSSHLS